jgi:hypothetical protein
MTFFMTLFTLFRSVAGCVMKQLPQNQSNHEQNIPAITVDATNKEEFRPPSPTPAYREADLMSSMLKRLGELEDKVDTLQSKPSEMPYEKEELLNAAVCRVDALEAELIATKKVKLLVPKFIVFIQSIRSITVDSFHQSMIIICSRRGEILSSHWIAQCTLQLSITGKLTFQR